MKKNSLKTSTAPSSKPSFGNTKGTTSNASRNRSSSKNFSSGSSNALGKPTAFKRSASIGGASYNFSCDTKPLIDSNSWKTSKPKFEKIASTKSFPDSWGANKAKFEKNSKSGSKYCNDSNWITGKPKPTDSKCSNNNSFGSTRPNGKNSLSADSQFSAVNCGPSAVSKNEKSRGDGLNSLKGSILSSSKSQITNITKTGQNPIVDYNYSSNKSKSEKSAFVSSYNKRWYEKSNSGLLTSSILSSSPSLFTEKSKNFNCSQLDSFNKINKATKDCNTGGFNSCSMKENSGKPKDQTTSYFDAVQLKKSQNGCDRSFKNDSKIRSCRHSAKDTLKTSHVSEKHSQNDHHFYNNLSKLFHLKGSSHNKHESSMSHFVNPTIPVPKETNTVPLYGSPLIESCKANGNSDFKSHENILKGNSATYKDSKLKDKSKKVSLSGNSLNSKYEIPTNSGCSKVTIFGSAVSDSSNYSPDAFGSNTFSSPILTSPDTHAHKMSHGFNKHIFGHLFAKHSVDKMAKHSDGNSSKVPSTIIGANHVNDDLNHHIYNETIKGSIGCKTKGDSVHEGIINICGSETQKSSISSSNDVSNPLNSNQSTKAKKSCSFKEEVQSATVTCQDSQRKIFHNDEKTKVIAELLKSYCKQQGKEVRRDNELKPTQKNQLGINKQHDDVVQCAGRSDVDNIHFSHSGSGSVENHVTLNPFLCTPVSSINQRLNMQSTNAVNSNDDSNLAPSTSNNQKLKNSCKESLKFATNIKCSSPTQLETKDQINFSSLDNHSHLETAATYTEMAFRSFKLNKSAKVNDCFVKLPDVSSPSSNGVRRKVITNADIPTTQSNSSCIPPELKNGHLQLFKSSNILSSFSNLTHVISTGPLKKSNKEQQHNNSKRKVGETSPSIIHSINDNFAFTSSGIPNGGIIPSLDDGNHQASNFQNSHSTKKTSKYNKQKHSPFVEMYHDHAFPFMVNLRGHHVPVSSHARDAILTALMFSSVNSNRKKVCPKQQRSVSRRDLQQFGSHQNSIGLSAIGLALPRASTQPTILETRWEESDNYDNPLPETPPYMILSSKSENDLESEDYVKGRHLDSHTVDDFRNSYEKVTKVINHGRELLAVGNYLQACVEFEVGLKLMDCILESKIDDSDMSNLDKTICKSVQEVIRVDRKSALEGYSDAQAGYVAPRQEQSQALPDGAPSAPPSYTDVLREDLAKNFFSCGVHCMNASQQIVKELPGTVVPSAPSAEVCDVLPSSPPSYELHENVLHNRTEDASPQKREPIESNDSQLPSESLNLDSSTGNNQRTNPISPCAKIGEREQSSYITESATLNEKSSVNSVHCESNRNVNNNLENNVNNGSVPGQQPKCQILTSPLSTVEGNSHVTAATNGKSQFTLCPCLLNTEKTKPLDLHIVSECCKVPERALLTHDERHLSEGLISKPKDCMECIDTKVNGLKTSPLLTVVTKQPNEKEIQAPALFYKRIEEGELTKECIEKGSQTHSGKSEDLTIMPSKSLNVSGFGSSDSTIQTREHLVNVNLPPTPPPFSLGQLPPPGQLPLFPPIVSSSKCLSFPPDVEVSKENISHIVKSKLKKAEQKSELIKVLKETEIENRPISTYLQNSHSSVKDCHSSVKDCHTSVKDCHTLIKDGNTPIKVCSSPVFYEKLGELSLTNNNSRKGTNNKNKKCKYESKLLRSDETGHPLNQAKQTMSARTIVLDPFLFEDPFADDCFCRNLGEEDEPFLYDDQNYEFSLQENPKQDLERIFAPICSFDCYNDESPLISCFTQYQYNKSESSLYSNSSTEVTKNKLFNISNLCYSNLEACQSHDELRPINGSAVWSSKSSTMESYSIASSKTSELKSSGLKLHETNKMCLNQTYSHNSLVDDHDGESIHDMTKEPEFLNGTSPSSVRHKNSFISDTTEGLLSMEKDLQLIMTEQNFRSCEENVGDRRTIWNEKSPNLGNLYKPTSREVLVHSNSKRQEDELPIYQNLNQETTGLEQISEEDSESPTKGSVDNKHLPKTKGENTSTSVTTVLGANPVVSTKNKDSSPKSFNSKLETNIIKGLKSLSFPSFIYNKTNRQFSDEGRLIGQSSFFVDFENGKEGGVTIMSLEDVRVYFMDSTQNITSPSSNQTITISQKKENTHFDGSICLEIGKKPWLKYLNVSSTKVLKTIKKVYIIEENPDSHFAIQLSSKTKFSILDQLEEILKNNSDYQIEALAKSTSMKEHRKFISIMENFIKEKSPGFYIQAHDLSRKSTRAVQNAAASVSKGIMNFHNSKLAIGDAPSTSPMTLKLNGQMEILQIKGRLLEEAQWKNSVVFI